eukprot:1137618_1
MGCTLSIICVQILWNVHSQWVDIWFDDGTDNAEWSYTSPSNEYIYFNYDYHNGCYDNGCIVLWAENGKPQSLYRGGTNITLYSKLRLKYQMSTYKLEANDSCWLRYAYDNITDMHLIKSIVAATPYGVMHSYTNQNVSFPSAVGKNMMWISLETLDAGGGDEDVCYWDNILLQGVLTTPNPTSHPSTHPTIGPTAYPTHQPSVNPTLKPTSQPTSHPTLQPTVYPTSQPTVNPTNNPTFQPSKSTTDPSNIPTSNPIVEPTQIPTSNPIINPVTDPPSADQTPNPTVHPFQSTIIETTANTHDDVTDIGTNASGNVGHNTNIIAIVLAGVVLVLLCVCFWKKCCKRKPKVSAVYAVNRDNKAKSMSMNPMVQPSARDSRPQLSSAVVSDSVAKLEPKSGSENPERGAIGSPLGRSQDNISIEPGIMQFIPVGTGTQISNVDSYSFGSNEPGNLSMMETAGRRAIRHWLHNVVQLPEYYDCFINNGYETMVFVKDISNAAQLQEIGIASVEHQMIVLQEIEELKNEPSEKVDEQVMVMVVSQEGD